VVDLYVKRIYLEELHIAIGSLPFSNGHSPFFYQGYLLHFVQAAKLMEVHNV
jgi:hypothetical protein